MCDKTVLRKTSGPNREMLTGQYGSLHNVVSDDLCYSSNNSHVIKS
jgi:hypothetical protein